MNHRSFPLGRNFRKIAEVYVTQSKSKVPPKPQPKEKKPAPAAVATELDELEQRIAKRACDKAALHVQQSAALLLRYLNASSDSN
jgi:hypothetical protein